MRCNAASPVTIPPEAGTPRERSPTSPQEEPGRLPDVFPNMGHYRFYELSPSDHITAGHSIECGSDDEAMRAARTLLERAAGVEVWTSNNCVGPPERRCPPSLGPAAGRLDGSC